VKKGKKAGSALKRNELAQKRKRSGMQKKKEERRLNSENE
jgi:hypothetical protein